MKSLRRGFLFYAFCLFFLFILISFKLEKIEQKQDIIKDRKNKKVDVIRYVKFINISLFF